MKRAKITFYVEPSDPEHSTGLTNDDFEEISAAIAGVGGDEVEFEVVEDES